MLLCSSLSSLVAGCAGHLSGIGNGNGNACACVYMFVNVCESFGPYGPQRAEEEKMMI